MAVQLVIIITFTLLFIPSTVISTPFTYEEGVRNPFAHIPRHIKVKIDKTEYFKQRRDRLIEKFDLKENKNTQNYALISQCVTIKDSYLKESAAVPSF